MYTASWSSPTDNLALLTFVGLLILFITVVIDILSVSITGDNVCTWLVNVRSILNDLAPLSSDDSLIPEHISEGANNGLSSLNTISLNIPSLENDASLTVLPSLIDVPLIVLILAVRLVLGSNILSIWGTNISYWIFCVATVLVPPDTIPSLPIDEVLIS